MNSMQTVDLLPGRDAPEDERRRALGSGSQSRRTPMAQRAGSGSVPDGHDVPLKQLLRWADDGGSLAR